MSILNGTLRLARTLLPAALALSAVASWAAVSVTDMAVSQTGNNTVLTYRLNQDATSVSIVAGGQTYTGGTAKGVNSVNLPLNITGSATITATAAADNGGAAGGVILVPLTNPVSPTDAANGQIVGVAVNKRAGSPYRGRIYIPYGPSQTIKRLDVFSADGALQQTKDLTTVYTSGSWPYGIGVAQTDTQDRLIVANRSLSRWKVLFPDLSQGVEYPQTTNTPGMQITPNTDPATKDTYPWNIWGSDNAKTGGFRHAVADLSVAANWSLINASECKNGPSNLSDPVPAVDLTNQVMYKVMRSDGGVGAITTTEVDPLTSTTFTTYLCKYTSPKDSATSWTRDDAWGLNLVASIKANLGDGTVDPTGLNAGGIALDKGFDAENLANSRVWVTISGTYTPAGGTSTNINRIYHVRADDGNIIPADTIDLQTIGAVAPATTGPMANKAGHYMDVTGVGNIAIALNSGMFPSVISPNAPRYFAVIAPNSTGPTTDVTTVASLVPPLSAIAKTSQDRVGNSGAGSITFTVSCSDSAGIVADNVQVSADLTQLGGTTGVSLTRGTVSGDGKSADYTTTFSVLATTPVGAYDIPFTVTSSSKNLTVTATQTIYNTFIPKWTKNVDGAVNSSTATNGTIAYVGTDNGKVYAFNTNTAGGDALASFGTGGVVTLAEPVKGKIVFGNGKLYVPGTNHVTILNGRTGETLGVSPAIANPVVAVQRGADATAAIFVGGGDNKIHALDGITGAALSAVSADLGAAVLNIEIGPSTTGIAPDMLVVGCTAGDINGVNGKIVMLKSSDLTPAFIDGGTFLPIEYVDANGPVKSRPAFGKLADGSDFFAVGSTSGLWAIDANTGAKQTWTVGGGGGANVGGNPYTTAFPVDASPSIAQRAAGEPTITFTVTSGAVYQIWAGNADPAGQRITFGGWPVGLTTPPGLGGFAAGGGVTVKRGYAVGTTTNARVGYMGSDGGDKRFFGLEMLPDDITYNAKGTKTHIFDPADTVTFPGYTAGAFNSIPAITGNSVVVGSDAQKVYGFTTLQDVAAYVTSVTPPVGGTGVATSGTVISIVYNADIDTFNMSADNLKLVLDGVVVDSTIGTGADSKTITITPNANLVANKWYTVLASGLLDATGLVVEPFSSSFYTGIPVVTVVKGDVNGDKTFNSADVKAALNIAAGLVAATPANLTVGDYYQPGSKTPDGKITLEDALFLARVLAGKDTLP